MPGEFAWNVTVIVFDCPAVNELEVEEGEQLVSGAEQDADSAKVPVKPPWFVTVKEAVVEPSGTEIVDAAAWTYGCGQFVVVGSQIRLASERASCVRSSPFRSATVGARASTNATTERKGVPCTTRRRVVIIVSAGEGTI